MGTTKLRKEGTPRWPKRRTQVRLCPSERRVLQHLDRAGRTGAWLVARARCVLLGARGLGTRAIARAVGRDPNWVRKWHRRFVRLRLNGLFDQPRAGRPARFSPRGAA